MQIILKIELIIFIATLFGCNSDMHYNYNAAKYVYTKDTCSDGSLLQQGLMRNGIPIEDWYTYDCNNHLGRICIYLDSSGDFNSRSCILIYLDKKNGSVSFIEKYYKGKFIYRKWISDDTLQVNYIPK